jgi:hypothetical protein
MDPDPDPGGPNIRIRIRNTAALGIGGDRECWNTLERRCPGNVPSFDVGYRTWFFSPVLSFRIGSGFSCFSGSRLAIQTYKRPNLPPKKYKVRHFRKYGKELVVFAWFETTFGKLESFMEV